MVLSLISLRRQRPHVLTIQDLKKQTALRLAQEQHNRGVSGTEHGKSSRFPVSANERQFGSHKQREDSSYVDGDRELHFSAKRGPANREYRDSASGQYEHAPSVEIDRGDEGSHPYQNRGRLDTPPFHTVPYGIGGPSSVVSSPRSRIGSDFSAQQMREDYANAQGESTRYGSKFMQTNKNVKSTKHNQSSGLPEPPVTILQHTAISPSPRQPHQAYPRTVQTQKPEHGNLEGIGCVSFPDYPIRRTESGNISVLSAASFPDSHVGGRSNIRSGTPLSVGTPSHHYGGQSSSSPAHSHLQGPGGKHSKLAHGLTVQELKEMTKARLHVETSEKTDEETPKQVHQHQQPYMQMNQRHLQSPKNFASHTLGSRSFGESRNVNQPYSKNRQSPSGATASTPPSFIQTQVNNAPQTHPGFSAPTRLFPGSQSQFEGVGLNMQQTSNISNNTFQPIGRNRQNQCCNSKQSMDALETGSVTSVNSGLGSEYLGSESAFSSVSGRFQAPPVGIWAGTDELPYDGDGMLTLPSSSAMFDTSVGGPANRRRTATMSPPVLSNLHEDRPLNLSEYGGDDLTHPVYTRSRNNTAPPSTLSRNTLASSRGNFEVTGSSSFGQTPSPQNLQMNYNSSGMGDNHNNCLQVQQSSVPPQMSAEKAEAFTSGLLHPLPLGTEYRGVSSGGLSMSDDLANSMAESVLFPHMGGDQRLLSLNGGNEFQEYSPSTVFRNNLESEQKNNLFFSEASPRGEMTLNSTSSGGLLFSDSWGALSGMTGGPNLNEDYQELSDNLYAKLALKNAEQTPHFSSLVSRIDPELNARTSSLSRAGDQPTAEQLLFIDQSNTMEPSIGRNTTCCFPQGTASPPPSYSGENRDSTNQGVSPSSSSSSSSNNLGGTKKRIGRKNRRKLRSRKEQQ
eukprot:scaffold21210_cov53-Attheya_sp.AAC.5